jgi:hypothetical protein
MAASQLIQEMIDGQTYWLAEPRTNTTVLPPVVHLLPNYDEYIVGYKDRRAAFDQRDTKMENPRDSIVFSHTILIDGKVSGAWKRSFSRGQVQLEVKPFASFSAAEEEARAAAVQHYSEFHGMPVIRI